MKIIPTPREVIMGEGSLALSSITALKIQLGSDRRMTKIATTVRNEISELVGKTAKLMVCTCACSETPILYITHGEEGEGYTLTINEKGITVKGDGAHGAYNAMQTLRQIIHEYGDTLPYVTINDAPDFPERGFYHDITRGRVPTLEMLKKTADDLAYYKISQLQLYVEDAYEFVEYDGIMEAHEVLSADEVTALDDYCYDNFIELVPSLSTFGHLYNLLQSKQWRHLCEYDDWHPWQHFWLEKMAHHTIDVSNDESIKVVGSMIDQFIPLFRSERFNICCDETFDLCQGRNKGKDEGEEYFKFLKKIIDHVNSRGKTVMMWGDIALNHPEKLSEIPEGTIMLNWTYEKNPMEEKVETLAKAGMKQIVCPGTSSWNRFIEEIDRSEGNITNLVDYGAKWGAMGILNTNWGDFGHIAPWNCNLYGMVIGAEKGWNADGKLSEEFEMAASSLLFDSDEINVIDLIRTMGRCERTCDWMLFEYWYSANTVEGRTTRLELDPEKAIANNAKLDEVIATLKSISETDDRYVDLLLSCRAIQIMNRVHLRINCIPGYEDGEAILRDVEAWLPEYRASWLRENKLSQLDNVDKFMREIAVMPVSSMAEAEVAETFQRNS